MGTQRRIRHKIFEWLRRYAPNEIAGWAGQRGAAAVTYELTGSYAAAVIAATIGATGRSWPMRVLVANGLAARTIAVEFGPAEAIDSIEKTEFAGISTVPPGCYAIARDGDVRIYPYWDWEIPTAEQMQADTRSEAEIVDEFQDALVDSVRERLLADVEVASYLSGGIDSCAVLGLAQQEMDRPIRAFTLTFENPLYDEARIAEAQAKHVGATYHPIPITGREIADSFKDAIWYAETQMFNGHGVAKYLLSRAVRAAGIKVVFTGEGADEMLGGYPYFRVDALNDNAALRAGRNRRCSMRCSAPMRRLARC